MKLIGTFTEEQVKAGDDKTAKAKAEAGGELRYFVPKFRRRKGRTVMELYGMTASEYAASTRI